MPAAVLSKELFPPNERLVQAFDAVKTVAAHNSAALTPAEQAELSDLLRQAQEDRAELAQARAWLVEQLNGPTPKDVEVERLTEALGGARAKETEVETALTPLVDNANELLSPAGSLPHEIERLMLERKAILEGWITFYRQLREMLERQLTERRTVSDGVLRARPTKGKTDHRDITREIIARFPKILATLAK
jgi:small-conductance mechanosensitive channel